MVSIPKPDFHHGLLGDKDVEFVTTLAQTEVKKKFKLEDMVFAGQLAL